jgi:response regulator NasT
VQHNEHRNPGIAVAEDDGDQRQMMVETLKQLGYRVVCAVSNGAELLASGDLSQVDVALLDLDMPILDGLEAAEELSHLGIPVVLISGLPESDQLVMEREPVAVRLTKPVNSEKINAAIQTALATRTDRESQP